MAKLLLNLRNVGDDEYADVCTLLDQHGIAWYRTEPSPWGISNGGLWLREDADHPRAKALMASTRRRAACACGPSASRHCVMARRRPSAACSGGGRSTWCWYCWGWWLRRRWCCCRSCCCGVERSAGLHPAPADATATATAGNPWRAGRCGQAGHAVNPLRGPAQPLATVRSGACDAVLRKQSALTLGGSMAPSMAPTVPPAHTALPLTGFGCLPGPDPSAVQRALTPESVCAGGRR